MPVPSLDQRLSMALEAGNLALWVWYPKTSKIEWAGDVQTVMGRRIDGYDGSLGTISDAVIPEDRQSLQDAIEGALTQDGNYRVDFRIRRADGQLRWIRSVGKVERDTDGTPSAFLGVVQDVTDTKHNEEIRARFIEQIIVAEDAERQRVARELHDGIGQCLTSLLVGLAPLERELAAGSPGLERLASLRALAAQGIEEVKQIARGLHPWVLDDLGFVPAVERLVEEHRVGCGLEIDLHLRGLDSRLPRLVETALYRILQEALTNIVRHASARTVSLIVDASETAVGLIVEDDGRGFDPGPEPEPGRSGSGLGLQSMRERVAGLRGALTLESSPGAGTTLYVKIPLGPAARPSGS